EGVPRAAQEDLDRNELPAVGEMAAAEPSVDPHRLAVDGEVTADMERRRRRDLNRDVSVRRTDGRRPEVPETQSSTQTGRGHVGKAAGLRRLELADRRPARARHVDALQHYDGRVYERSSRSVRQVPAQLSPASESKVEMGCVVVSMSVVRLATGHQP